MKIVRGVLYIWGVEEVAGAHRVEERVVRDRPGQLVAVDEEARDLGAVGERRRQGPGERVLVHLEMREVDPGADGRRYGPLQVGVSQIAARRARKGGGKAHGGQGCERRRQCTGGSASGVSGRFRWSERFFRRRDSDTCQHGAWDVECPSTLLRSP